MRVLIWRFGRFVKETPNLKVVNIVIIAESMFSALIFRILLSAAMFLMYKMAAEQLSHYDRGTKPLRNQLN